MIPAQQVQCQDRSHDTNVLYTICTFYYFFVVPLLTVSDVFTITKIFIVKGQSNGVHQNSANGSREDGAVDYIPWSE